MTQLQSMPVAPSREELMKEEPPAWFLNQLAGKPSGPISRYEDFEAAMQAGGDNPSQTFAQLLDDSWKSMPPENIARVQEHWVRESAYKDAGIYGDKTRKKILERRTGEAEQAFPEVKFKGAEYRKLVGLFATARSVVAKWNETGNMNSADDEILAVPKQDRAKFNQIMGEVAERDLLKDEGFLGKLGQRAMIGVSGIAENVKRGVAKGMQMVPGKFGDSTLDSLEYASDVKRTIIQSGNPAKGSNWAQEAVLSAAEMAPAMAASTIVPLAKAGAVQQFVTQTAFWTTQLAPDIEKDLVQRGLPRNLATPLAAATAIAEGAVENINPRQLMGIASSGGKAGLRNYVFETLKSYLKEYSEEVAQGAMEIGAHKAASMVWPDVKFDGKQEAYQLAQDLRKMGPALAVMMGPGAAASGVQEYQAGQARLEAKDRADRWRQVTDIGERKERMAAGMQPPPAATGPTTGISSDDLAKYYNGNESAAAAGRWATENPGKNPPVSLWVAPIEEGGFGFPEALVYNRSIRKGLADRWARILPENNRARIEQTRDAEDPALNPPAGTPPRMREYRQPRLEYKPKQGEGGPPQNLDDIMAEIDQAMGYVEEPVETAEPEPATRVASEEDLSVADMVPTPLVVPKESTTAAPTQFSTPEWKEKRVAELTAKKRKSGNDKYRRNPQMADSDAAREVEEEAEMLEKYPPGTELDIKGYTMPFRVEPDGKLTEISTGRNMGDNAGAVLRGYKPEQIKVVSKPAVEVAPSQAAEVPVAEAEPTKQAAPAAVAQNVAMHRKLIDDIAKNVAKSYRGVDLADLQSEGSVALMEAAEKFDPSKGTKFEHYARAAIHNRLLDFANRQGKPLARGGQALPEPSVEPGEPRLDKQDEVEWALEKFKQLPVEQQETLTKWLKSGRKVPMAAIALEEGVSRQAMSERVRKAILALQKEAKKPAPPAQVEPVAPVKAKASAPAQLTQQQMYGVATMLATNTLEPTLKRLSDNPLAQAFANEIDKHFKKRDGFVPKAVTAIINERAGMQAEPAKTAMPKRKPQKGRIQWSTVEDAIERINVIREALGNALSYDELKELKASLSYFTKAELDEIRQRIGQKTTSRTKKESIELLHGWPYIRRETHDRTRFGGTDEERARDAAVEADQQNPARQALFGTPKPVAKEVVAPEGLGKAGITLKRTSKRWTVTGISQEQFDGIKEKYQGKRLGNGGYSFQSDPTEGLTDIAREIAAEAERNASAKARGMVVTSIGELTPEQAEAYKEERKARLEIARQAMSERNAGVDELLAQFVPSRRRGEFKLELLRAAEQSDPSSVARFDEMVEYAKDHPELGLPQDEDGLFQMLTREAFRDDDAALSDQIDNELATELVNLPDDEGDASFDVEELERQQTAIPGFEAEAASAERSDQARASRGKFESKKGKQKTFLTDMKGTKYAPGTQPLFETEGLPQETDKGTATGDKAAAAHAKALAELDNIGRIGKEKSSAFLDPKIYASIAKFVAYEVEAGVYKFAAALQAIRDKFGEAKTKQLEPYLKEAWASARKLFPDKPIDDPDAPPFVPPPTPTPAPAPSPKTPEVTSIKNRIVEELKAKRGEPPVGTAPAETLQMWLDTAARMIVRDPTLPTTLVAELNRAPRPHNKMEVAVLTLYGRRLEDAYVFNSEILNDAQKAGDSVRVSQYTTALNVIRLDMNELYDATKASGTETGRGLVARRIELLRDYSLHPLLRRLMVARRGVAVDPQKDAEAYAEVKRLSARVKELEAKIATREEKAAENFVDAAIDDDLKKAKEDIERINKAKKTAPTKAAERKTAKQQAVVVAKDEWLAAVKKASTTAHALAPLELIPPAMKLIRAYVELGVASFTEFVANLHKDGIYSDETRPTMAAAWDRVVKEDGLKGPKVNADDPRSISRLARKLMRWAVESGITDREAVVDTVHAELVKVMPNITRRETKDAMSGYGDFKELSKDAVSLMVRDLKGQLQQLSKLEDMAAGRAPEKTGIERREPSDVERHYIQLVNEAKKLGGYVVTDPAKQLKSALAAAKTAIQHRIADMEAEIAAKEKLIKSHRVLEADQELKDLRQRRDELRKIHEAVFPQTVSDEEKILRAGKALDRAIDQLEAAIAKGEIRPREKGQPLQSPELDAKRARLEALRARRDELRLLDPQYQAELEARSTAAYKAHLAERLADLQQRIANRDFAKKPVKRRVLDKETLKLKFEVDQEKRKFDKLEEAWRRKSMGWGEWSMDQAFETIRMSRSLMTSLDWSAIGRQAWVSTVAHPLLTLKTFPEVWRSTWSEEGAHAAAEAIRNRANAQLYEQAKLEITTLEGRLSKQEEAYMGRWSNSKFAKWTGVAMSERAYVTFLNRMRADLFDLMVAGLGEKDGIGLDQARVIANFVNVATGRGSLGKFQAAGTALATTFFAPRYVMSRFQMLIGQPLWRGDRQTRKIIAREYARAMVGISTFYMGVALFGMGFDDDDERKPRLEFDPRSADFGKIRVWQVRIDPMGGFSQAIVLIARELTGERKTQGGAIIPIRGENVPFKGKTGWTILSDFARSKFSPLIGGSVDLLAGENIIGQDVTASTVAIKSVTPLILGDITKALREMSIPAAAAAGMAAFFGANVNAYEEGDVGQFYSDRYRLQQDKKQQGKGFTEKTGLAKANRIASLLSDLKELQKSQEDAGTDTAQTGLYAVGAARWAQGKDEIPRYPNPLAAQDLPADVRGVIESHLATTAYSATALATLRNANPEKVQAQEDAQAYLRSLDVDQGHLLDLLLDKCRRQGMGPEALSSRRGRLVRALTAE